MERIKGIDSIRFVCAVVVVIDHYGVPLSQFISPVSQSGEKIIRGISGCLFNGPAAVIIFFVISGFCIHFPYHNKTSFNLLSYFSRRIIRICVPALFAVALYTYLGHKLEPPLYHVFWSIICELIYYIFYPLFFLLKSKLPFYRLTVLAYLTAIILSVTHLELIEAAYGNYGAFGWFTWIIGLPCWLTGCYLAESYQKFSVVRPSVLWILRLCIFVISVLIKTVRFHIDSVFSSYVFSLTLFAIVIYFWFGFEIVYYKARQPAPLLERAGRWSYSLYMIHPIVPTILTLIGFNHLASLPDQVVWLPSALLLSYMFFLVVERPSHKLAIIISNQLKMMMGFTVRELPETA